MESLYLFFFSGAVFELLMRLFTKGNDNNNKKNIINMLMFPQIIIIKPHKKSTLEIVCRLDQPGNPVR